MRPPVGKRPLALPVQPIRQRWAESESVPGLAAAFGISPPTVRRRLPQLPDWPPGPYEVPAPR
ncbi:hypothetical protein ACFVQ9_25950 [Streptomyces goshikiensis]|uniref:hypothetical protein n=1 Tax=Streptomyces goshikiensis TaxID=1942 RepID=UPI0036795E84